MIFVSETVGHGADSPCVEWPLARDRYGYGVIKHGGHWIRAHRLIYEMYVGAIPQGMHILHRCDNRACVNPYHLWAGTHAENMADAAAKGRMAMTDKSQAKLGWDAVCEIRSSKEPLRALAKKFGVGKSTIHSARQGKTWRKPT